VLPAGGSAVELDSYELCAQTTVSVSVGLVISVDCAVSTEPHRYVIIQSLDTTAEILCIADVCVYESRQSAITFFPGTLVTLH